MSESVILNSPVLFAGILIVILLMTFEKKTQSSGFILPIISAVLSLLIVFVSILYGAAWEELIIVILIFLLVLFLCMLYFLYFHWIVLLLSLV